MALKLGFRPQEPLETKERRGRTRETRRKRKGMKLTTMGTMEAKMRLQLEAAKTPTLTSTRW